MMGATDIGTILNRTDICTLSGDCISDNDTDNMAYCLYTKSIKSSDTANIE